MKYLFILYGAIFAVLALIYGAEQHMSDPLNPSYDGVKNQHHHELVANFAGATMVAFLLLAIFFAIGFYLWEKRHDHAHS